MKLLCAQVAKDLLGDGIDVSLMQSPFKKLYEIKINSINTGQLDCISTGFNSDNWKP